MRPKSHLLITFVRELCNATFLPGQLSAFPATYSCPLQLYITFNELENHLSIFLNVQLESFLKILPAHMKVLHSSLCTSWLYMQTNWTGVGLYNWSWEHELLKLFLTCKNRCWWCRCCSGKCHWYEVFPCMPVGITEEVLCTFVSHELVEEIGHDQRYQSPAVKKLYEKISKSE